MKCIMVDMLEYYVGIFTTAVESLLKIFLVV